MKTSAWVLIGILLTILVSPLVAKASDEKKLPTVAELINDLDSPKYAIREAAVKSLKGKMNFELYVKLMNLSNPSLEVVRRVQKIVVDYESKFVQDHKEDYKVDIDYPATPWIWLQEEGDGYNYSSYYLKESHASGVKQDGSLNWGDWRFATHIWFSERIHEEILSCLRQCKSEKGFNCLMESKIEAIRGDLQRMVQREDRWWNDSKRENPLRKEQKPDF